MVVRRRAVLKGIGAGAVSLGLAACSTGGSDGAGGAAATTAGTGGTASGAGGPYSLTFDPSAYQELTTTISTGAGDKQVTYRFWRAIPYVANPVDVTYQSLNVSVPVTIDGTAVDATRVPILLANSVGGYLPSSVADATEVGGAGMGGGGMPGGAPGVATGSATGSGSATSGSSAEATSGSNEMLSASGEQVSLAKLALAAGYVVVEPGARGRTLTNSAGEYYGVAPAAIVDLKAAVRYVRANSGRLPGNPERIITSGVSAGGALSALQGASGDSPRYDAYLSELGAADASDAIFASGDWCPITDLEHADGAYEWCWGANPTASGQVDQSLSAALAGQFGTYQQGLGLSADGFGAVTADTYGAYLVATYLQPAATSALAALSEADRTAYLQSNTWITWSNNQATFAWKDFLTHVGTRKKTLPAFDAFDLSAGENNLFGLGTTQSRHFTQFSQDRSTAGSLTALGDDIPGTLSLMNPMTHLRENTATRAQHWWIRVGTADSDTSLTVVANLALQLRALGADVDAKMYWDRGHGANDDPAEFIAWIARISA